MKKIKNLFGLLLALVAITAFQACDDKVEYTPAEMPDNAQVFFAPSNASTIELSSSETSFSIPLSRVKCEEEVTVPLTVTGDETFLSLYTVPTSVTFAAGEATATLVVTYDPDAVGFDNYSKGAIEIGGEYATEYAISKYSFKVGIPAPWESLGMATFSDNYYFGATGQAEIFRNKLNPNEYRLYHPFHNLQVQASDGNYYNAEEFSFWSSEASEYLTFRLLQPGDMLGDTEVKGNGLVYFDMCNIGYNNSSYDEDVWILHPSELSSMQTEDKWSYNKVLLYQADGTPGQIQLAPLYYLFNAGGGWNQTQKADIITILFPGVVLADYSVAATYQGIYTGADGSVAVVGNATLGADAKDVRAIVASQTSDVQAILDAMAASEGPSETLPWVAVGESGNFSVPFDPNALGSEKLMIIVASIGQVEEAGETKNVAKEFATVNFEYYAGEKPWKSLGMGLYTDDIVLTSYSNMSAPTYQVEIMEHKEKPGLYRLMNPYTQAVYPYGDALVEMGATMAAEGSYIEVNAQDPNAVYINMQSTGCTVSADDGEVGFCTYPVYMINTGQLDYTTALEEGLFGTLEDGVITFGRFPFNNSTCDCIAYGSAGGAWYAGTTTGVKIVLPEAVPAEARTASNKAEQKHITLQRNGNKKSVRFVSASQYTAPKPFAMK